MSQVQFLTIDNKPIEYVWYGPSPDEATTLVFLHEGLGCVKMWRDFPAKVAAATGCGVLVYSRFGYGRSAACERPRPLRYMHDEALDILPQILAALNIQDAILIGHSDGGSIALIYAGGSESQILRGVVTTAAHVFCEQISVDSIREAREAYLHTNLRDKLKRYHGDNVDNAFWGWNDVWLEPAFMEWNIEEYLPAIKVPLLAIQGEDDQYGTVAQVESIVQNSGGPSELLLIPDCAHSPHRDKEQLTLEAIAEFVKRLLEQ